MKKHHVARITGESISGTHRHDLLVELPTIGDWCDTLHFTVVGGADGRKRHASVQVSIADLEDALERANAMRHA